jgi:nucleoside-triphosphatase
VDELERVALPALERAARQSGLVVIDEIGTMELFSERFRQEVHKVLDGERPLLAVIKAKGDAFLAAIKRRDDVQLFTVTIANRDDLPAVVCEHILPIVKHRQPS